MRSEFNLRLNWSTNCTVHPPIPTPTLTLSLDDRILKSSLGIKCELRPVVLSATVLIPLQRFAAAVNTQHY